MRRAPLILIVVLFGAWLVVKGRPWLDRAPAQTWATPILQPELAGELKEVRVPRGQRVCATEIPYGPDARYVVLTALTRRPAGPLLIEARAPGYRATARVPAGIGDNQQIVAPIAPATREVGGGTLCVVNEGRRRIGFYGVDQSVAGSVTTVDGEQQRQDLSVTLLTSPSKSLGSRLGSMLDHAAAFNPTSGWLLWILLALTMVGVPIALGVALGRAADEDDRADADPDAGPAPEPAVDQAASARP